MKIQILAASFAVFGLLAEGCAHVPTPQPRPDFRQALSKHLAAIDQRDLDALRPTLTNDNNLLVIFPGGQTLPDTNAVIDFHRNWFADTAWKFTPEVIKVIEGSDQSTAVLRYDYQDSPDGAPRASWLVLVFALEDGQWRLVHDQNTRIDAPTSSSTTPCPVASDPCRDFARG